MKKNELKNSLLNSINASDTQGLKDTIRYVRLEAVNVLKEKNITEGRKMVSDAKAILPFLLPEIDANSESYLIGKFVGEMDILDEILNIGLLGDEKISKTLEDVRSEDIPHINEIICSVYDNPGIRHGKLADLVGISKGALTPLMIKLEESGLISYSRPGKYKYYYLTDSGENYYKVKLADSKENTDLEYILENLKIILGHAKNYDELLQYIMDRLLHPGYKANGYVWVKRADKQYNIRETDINKVLNLSFAQSDQILRIPRNSMRYRELYEEPLIEVNSDVMSYSKFLLLTPLMNHKE